MGLPINFTFSGLEGNCWPATPHEFGVQLIQGLAGETDGDSTFFNDGDTTPSPDNRVYPWTPSSFSGSNPPAFIYHYVNGAWIMPNPIATGAVMMYTGTEASIVTFDGGEAGAITDTTGPMWEKLATMDARFPVGPGTFPSGAIINVGDQGGVEEHVLTRAELPNVSVDTLSQRRINVQDGGSAVVTTPDTSSTGAAFQATALPTEPLGDGDAHTNVPPYTGIFFIKRTARKFYRR